jgi:hypothetical protein
MRLIKIKNNDDLVKQLTATNESIREQIRQEKRGEVIRLEESTKFLQPIVSEMKALKPFVPPLPAIQASPILRPTPHLAIGDDSATSAIMDESESEDEFLPAIMEESESKDEFLSEAESDIVRLNLDKGINLKLLKRFNFDRPSKLYPLSKEKLNVLQKEISTVNRNKLGNDKKHAKTEENIAQINQNIEDMRQYRARLEFMTTSDEVTGSGIQYYSDPDTLIDRLQLLVASRAAGNTGVDNEISAIIDALVKDKHINKKRGLILHKKFM